MTPEKQIATYFQWHYEQVPGAAELGPLEGDVKDIVRALCSGLSLHSNFPPDAHFRMRQESAKNIRLIDCFMSQDGLFVVSPRTQEVLRRNTSSKSGLELLPVTLINHRDRVASEDYAVAHTTNLIDCIDPNASQYDWNPINAEQMLVSELVFDSSKLGEDDSLVRAKYISHLLLVRDQLAEELMKEGLRGLWMMRPSP